MNTRKHVLLNFGHQYDLHPKSLKYHMLFVEIISVCSRYSMLLDTEEPDNPSAGSEGAASNPAAGSGRAAPYPTIYHRHQHAF